MAEQLALEKQHQAVTPMSLIEMAAARGASIEQMAQLFELKLRIEADEERKAFNEAFSKFKAEAIRIVKNVQVSDGPLKGKKYADLFGVSDALIPLLSRHGLTHSWKLTKDEPQWIEVTCVLRHDKGHSESVSMGSAPDAGPGRNAIQARMSAVSYLERYTFLAVTGTAAGGTDNDGNGSKDEEAGKLDEGQFDDWLSAIQGAATFDELKARYLEALESAESAHDSGAAKVFADEKNKRFKQIQHALQQGAKR